MTSSLSSTEAVIELVTDDDQVTVAGPGAPWEEHGIALDQSPDGMFSTAFKTRTVSGAFQIGGRFAGHDIPVREMVLPFHLLDVGNGVEATVSRFRKLWPIDGSTEWRYTSAKSGLRWLTSRLSQQIAFSPERDWNVDGYAHAVVSALALQPMYESPKDADSWSNPSSGTHTDYLKISNPTDQKCWLEWSMDPATQWRFPDFSFGNEGKWRRAVGADAARMIVTPTLTSRLSVMADPMMETYVAADKSNVTGLFNGIEPMYWIPPYTEELVVPVQCTGPAGATITCTMRRFWSAESGLE
ncbi:hypothetical protein [Gordonia sp. (in: high G+C Gram-positive bacteria)]|uniref:hypothetical protein n=1 Tax=Gordonia sp. (in: high G+C Gram-positive bacteria) TaxID=84139 RepID=UPI001D5567D2|nr:hypothetical protein [Gordonia sp. (in: high G+C Gram-positive bacteria)]MCB1293649.1 hypothetical protein [Gordonia sp. (in: high G+C Gram-positive bacteria)]HMS74192.1 hypothetical protein [Gordonia sp. (in: high G+C Gram-positive bacteria)]HQV17801.1 hypothetical protein [Gordonia sp. (in: high G+C Gram-positive bacteria)]